MGNPKQKWTSEEEEALRAGVAKHGAGKWKHIQKDPEFNHLLFSRSNIDLKDKWRNLGAASGQLPRDKSKAPKAKAIQADAPATPLAIGWTSPPVTLPAQDAPAEVVIGDSSRPVPEGSNASKYDVMIFEALSTLKEPNGSDCSSIATFIEQRQQQVPQNFRRLVSSRLRRLVQQNKLEKVQNFYKIKTGAPVDTIGPSVKPNNSPPKPAPPTQGIGYRGDPIAEAAAAAAYKVAEAENKSFVAAEAVKEAERIASMAEDMEVFLQFAMECVEKAERGEVVILK